MAFTKGVLALASVVLVLVVVIGAQVQVAAAQSTLDLIGAWGVGTGRTLTVIIIQKPGVTDTAVGDVKTAILSTGTVSGQYVGWTGAFGATSGPIPLSFAVTVTSSNANGDITITLKKGTGDILGSTQISKSGGFIVSAKIMLSGAAFGSTLSSDSLQTIARHEFGHAVGLGHSTDSNDLMYPVLNSVPRYIGLCDISGLNTVYSNPSATSVSCA